VRTLLLLRHAKSSWDDASIRDFDRPLAPRGRRDAPTMGRLLRSESLDLDHVVCSTAVRARETLELAAKAGKYSGTVQYLDGIYEASASRLEGIVRSLPNGAATVLMVGHNPGFEDLVTHLCAPGGRMNVTMPTAALACIDIPAPEWNAVTEGSGTLRWLAVPKMLPD
jgi:phosphohistidine phosphatase